MDPGTIAIVIGTGISAMGQLQAGINARNNANTNAKGLFDLANADRLAGIENRKRQERANIKLAGMNRAIDPDKLDLLEDNAIEGALLEADITQAANISALQKENRGRAQIALGQQAFEQGVFGAFSSTLIGAGVAYGGVGSPLQTADTRSVFRLS